MIGTASLRFDQASEQVEGVVQQGTAFARMEEVIDAARVSDHHKGGVVVACVVASRARAPAPRSAAHGGSVRHPMRISPPSRSHAKAEPPPAQTEGRPTSRPTPTPLTLIEGPHVASN
jgi:hypothetical protein